MIQDGGTKYEHEDEVQEIPRRDGFLHSVVAFQLHKQQNCKHTPGIINISVNVAQNFDQYFELSDIKFGGIALD